MESKVKIKIKKSEFEVSTGEILACQTRLNKSIRIMSLSKNLQNGINLE